MYIKKILLGSLLILGCAVFAHSGAMAQSSDGFSLKKGALDNAEERRIRIALDYYTKGILAQKEHRHREAITNFKRALNYDSTSQEFRKGLIVSLLAMDEKDIARDETLKLQPYDAAALRLLVQLYRDAQDRDSTLMFMKLLVQADSTELDSRQRLVALYQQEGKIDSALMYLEQLAEITLSYAAYYNLGATQLQYGRPEEAVESFRRSIALESSQRNVPAYAGLADALGVLKRFDEQREALGELVELDPNHVPARRRLIEYFAERNMMDSALIHSQAEVQLTPRDHQAIRRLGIIAFNADSLDLAKEQFDLLISIGDNEFLNYFFLGRIFYAKDNYDYALINFRKVTSLVDTLAEGWIGMGQVYNVMDSLDAAARVYEEGANKVAEPADKVQLYFSLGATRERLKQFAEAETAFEQALTLDSMHAPTLNYLGYMLIEKNDRVSYGMDLVTRALKVSPGNSAYLDSYAWGLYRQGEFPEALDSLRRALEGVPGDPTIYDHVGDTFEKMSQPDSAQYYWRRALELDSTNTVIREKLNK